MGWGRSVNRKRVLVREQELTSVNLTEHNNNNEKKFSIQSVFCFGCVFPLSRKVDAPVLF